MPVVDTSFLVALRNREDRHHKRALKMAAKAGPFLVPGVILHEFLQVTWTMERSLHGSAAAGRSAREALTDIRAQPVFVVDPHYDPERVDEIYLGDVALSYADAVAVSVSIEQAQELWTFDEAQKEARANRSR